MKESLSLENQKHVFDDSYFFKFLESINLDRSNNSSQHKDRYKTTLSLKNLNNSMLINSLEQTSLSPVSALSYSFPFNKQTKKVFYTDWWTDFWDRFNKNNETFPKIITSEYNIFKGFNGFNSFESNQEISSILTSLISLQDSSSSDDILISDLFKSETSEAFQRINNRINKVLKDEVLSNSDTELRVSPSSKSSISTPNCKGLSYETYEKDLININKKIYENNQNIEYDENEKIIELENVIGLERLERMERFERMKSLNKLERLDKIDTNQQFDIYNTDKIQDYSYLKRPRKRVQSLKNNKLVFVLPEEINKYSKNVDDNKNISSDPNVGLKDLIEKQIKIKTEGRYSRSSIYRGVSKNGNQWQVLIMANKEKKYIGSYVTELEAAYAYDRVALQSHGNKAKTNFDYNPQQIVQIQKEGKSNNNNSHNHNT